MEFLQGDQKTRPHPGATTVGMTDQMKLELRENPESPILRCQTSDIKNIVDTVKSLKSW